MKLRRATNKWLLQRLDKPDTDLVDRIHKHAAQYPQPSDASQILFIVHPFYADAAGMPKNYDDFVKTTTQKAGFIISQHRQLRNSDEVSEEKRAQLLAEEKQTRSMPVK